ncbi:MAG: hypothetical protein U0996_25015 [Planctomycetaceae bacterium]
MIALKAVIEDDLLTDRAIDQVLRLTGNLVMQEHRERLPGHFENGAVKKYGYRPRTKKYMKYKAWKFKTQRPLFKTGALQAAILRSAKVIATSKKAELRARGSNESPLRDQYRRELEAFSEEEERANQFSFLQKFVKLAEDPSFKRKRRRTVG